MFVREGWRGRGVARLLLASLESEALNRGHGRMCIETGMAQREAIALYESSGYDVIPAFGEYRGNAASICFEKRLGPR
jgi:GNAT superfamily N-acetyltransferase